MTNNEVVTVVTVSGEYVGRLNSIQSDGTITLNDPRMLIHGEQGIGFARGVCMTSKENPERVTFQQYVLCTETNKEFSAAWTEAISGVKIIL
tara:strand:+ start:3690 stop:3965 length:276 start_codon:yes stop_codon:yes gene_type:complete